MEQIDCNVNMNKTLLEVTDLSSTTSGSVLSKVDMVGLHKYLDAVAHICDLRGTAGDAGMI